VLYVEGQPMILGNIRFLLHAIGISHAKISMKYPDCNTFTSFALIHFLIFVILRRNSIKVPGKDSIPGKDISLAFSLCSSAVN
jgi:hypothetical protein